MMESSYIELKLISCKDLKAFNFFQKLTVYALVSIDSHDPARKLTEEQKQQKRTPTDRESDGDGSNPEWNHKTRFNLGFLSQQHRSDPGDLFLRFEFRHDGVILGDKLLGECRVALADLIRDVAGVARFVCYEVRSADGKPNGIFNFSYRLKGIGIHSSQILEGRISGYPVLAPEDCAPVLSQAQYPSSEIENPCCSPTVCSVQEGPLYSPVAAEQFPPPPFVSYPPTGEYHYYYPPPPPPPQYPYPPPPVAQVYPPPPVAQVYPPPPVAQVYPPIEPGAHPWQSGPFFEHRW